MGRDAPGGETRSTCPCICMCCMRGCSCTEMRSTICRGPFCSCGCISCGAGAAGDCRRRPGAAGNAGEWSRPGAAGAPPGATRLACPAHGSRQRRGAAASFPGRLHGCRAARTVQARDVGGFVWGVANTWAEELGRPARLPRSRRGVLKRWRAGRARCETARSSLTRVLANPKLQNGAGIGPQLHPSVR